MGTVRGCKIATGSTVAAANVQHAKALPNSTQAGAIVEKINLGFRWRFVPAQEQTVVYVVTPEGAIDPCEQVVVFADFLGSHHGRKFVVIGQMLFTHAKLPIQGHWN